MQEIKIFELGYCEEKEYTRVVCVCKYKDKFVNQNLLFWKNEE